MSDNQQTDQILQAMRTTSDFQNKALDEVTKRLTTLAERLEPLVPLVEGMIGALDGTTSRLENVTVANVKVNQQLRQLYLVEKKEQEEEQRDHEVKAHLL